MDNQTSQALFLAISARLTGFETVELEGTGMTRTYFDTLSNNTAPEVLALFFEEAATILALKDDEAIDAAIRSRLMPDSSYDATAKVIILMWYTGEWYSGIGASANVASTQIDGPSYVQGLMWEAAETHPPGAKQPGYGSWAEPPIRIPA
ncbi:MAG: hypothetical protein KF800_19930 [Lysobacter sp.]|nr:hypothetical protein [Lysobacter sp.]